MEAEKPSFSHDQDTGEAEHSLCETIAVVIQALEQIDVVGTHLFQALEKLAIEGETLRIRMKRQRNIPEPIKEAKKVLGWSDGLAAAVRDYQAWCEGYRTDLE
nr:hypothetical protein [Ktedonobacteraceae bacterium]